MQFITKCILLIWLMGAGLICNELKGQGSSSDTLEQFFIRQLKHNKNLSYATYGLATLYFESGNYKQAIAYAKDNLRTINDFDTACTLIYARSLEMVGRYGKAERVYRKAIQRFSNSHELWLSYGFTLYKLRKYDEAEKALETSIRQNPFVPSAHYLLGYSMLENKNNPACLQAWLFGLMADSDTLRSAEMLRMMYYYLQQCYDSIHIPFFAPRLSLKYPNQLFLYNYNPDKFEKFYLQLNILSFCQQLAEKIKQYPMPTLYSRFFKALDENNLLETYCYFTCRNLNRNDLKSWYQANRKKLEQLAELLDTHLTKPF